MSLLQYSIKNMIGGVSQQPASVRLQNQCEELVNCIPSAVDFLKRRPGTNHLSRLLDSLPETAFVDFIIRGEDEAGIIIVNEGIASIYKMDGTLFKNFTYNSYLSTTNPKRDIKLLTINDYTFLLNTTVQIKGTRKAPLPEQGGFVFVKQAAYGAEYRITINGRIYKYVTPINDLSGAYKLSIDLIAEELTKKINTGASVAKYWRFRCPDNHITSAKDGSPAPSSCTARVPDENGILHNCGKPVSNVGFEYADEVGGTPDPDVEVVQKGCILWIKKARSVTVEDNMAGAYLQYFKNKTTYFTDLPVTAPNGYVMEISGDPDNRFDNYYVRFEKLETESDEIGRGNWIETVGPGSGYYISNATMPVSVTLFRDTALILPVSWEERRAGDDTSCPAPSFVDKSIKDIFFYRNRLCFLTEDSVCMSEAGEFFNFFNTTATALLDSDPIDISTGGTKVSSLRYAVPYNEGLFLYSGSTLFVAEHGDVLSSATISIRPLIQFDTEISARPVVMDTSIFYVTRRGDYTAMREYRPNDAGDIYGYSGDITSHIPRYIPYGITKLAFCMEEGMLFAATGNDRHVYVYSYQNGTSNERIQSAWGRWEFGGYVRGMEAIRGALYLVMQYPDGIFLERLIIGERDGILKDRKGLTGSETDYVSRYVYPAQYLRFDSRGPTTTGGKVMLRTLTVRHEDTEAFKIIIERRNRRPEERLIRPSETETRTAILAGNEDVTITLESVGAERFKFVESRFEAVFAARSRII